MLCLVIESEENMQRLAKIQAAMARGYMDGFNLLLLNAAFRGPSHVPPPSGASGQEN